MNQIFYPKQLLASTNKRIQNQCFFAMPFSNKYKNIYDTLSIYLQNENYDPYRVDDNSEASVPIITLILNGLASSQYIIVDISESNANVFYELGIAQTLKDAENIFIIKNSYSKTPFDIQHLQYIEYDENNLKELAKKLLARLQACQYKNEFWNALYKQNIINEKQLDSFISYCSTIFSKDDIEIYTDILEKSSDFFPLNTSIKKAILKIDKVIRQEIRQPKSEEFISMLFLLFNKVLLFCCKDDKVSSYIKEFLSLSSYEDIRFEQLISMQTDLAIELASHSKLEDISLSWIIEYFQRSKSTKVDLNRYKLEAFLLKTNLTSVNEHIVNAIVSNNHYIREHMADIAGEKGLSYAEENLIVQLKREDNIYTAASIMECLGKIKSDRGIKEIYNWVNKNANDIINHENYFVLKHARNALLKNSDLLIKFDNKYLELLKSKGVL